MELHKKSECHEQQYIRQYILYKHFYMIECSQELQIFFTKFSHFLVILYLKGKYREKNIIINLIIYVLFMFDSNGKSFSFI